jgi:acyl CoA:acetate/3-ketoacid CoA transferase alpha subunit
VVPNDYVIGTLLGNAAGTKNYEYLTALLKKMMHLELVPNDTMLKKLEAAAQHTPRVSTSVLTTNIFC